MTFLKVLQPDAIRSVPLHVATATEPSCEEGFYPEEGDGAGRFRWMSDRGVLRFDADAESRYIELWVLSEFHDLSQRLLARTADAAEEYVLPQGWSPLSLLVPAGAERLELRVNKPFPPEY